MEPTKTITVFFILCLFWRLLGWASGKIDRSSTGIAGVMITGIMLLVCVDCEIHSTSYLTRSSNNSSRHSIQYNYLFTCLDRILLAAVI